MDCKAEWRVALTPTRREYIHVGSKAASMRLTVGVSATRHSALRFLILHSSDSLSPIAFYGGEGWGEGEEIFYATNECKRKFIIGSRYARKTITHYSRQ